MTKTEKARNIITKIEAYEKLFDIDDLAVRFTNNLYKTGDLLANCGYDNHPAENTWDYAANDIVNNLISLKNTRHCYLISLNYDRTELLLTGHTNMNAKVIATLF